jgi:prophage antirepressor-like protein
VKKGIASSGAPAGSAPREGEAVPFFIGGAMKIEVWNGHEIRFVEKDGEWWAVAFDVAKALGYEDAAHIARMIDDDLAALHKVEISSEGKPGRRKSQKMVVLREQGIYQAIFLSQRTEAKEFRRWVCDIIKALRASLGLSGYEAFRLMDREHQKEAMRRLNERLHAPVKVDYIKANTIADKAVSTRHGFPKMVKKGAMSEAMPRDREPALDDVVSLMVLNERLGLGLSVSAAVYRKYGAGKEAA